MAEDRYAAGMEVRRAVLGDERVDKSEAEKTDFDADFLRFITETAWGWAWTRPGLDWRTRSLLNIAMLSVLGREEELALHLRATAKTGASRDDVKEVLIQVGAYAGVPTANAAMRIAKRVFAEMDGAGKRGSP